MNFWDAFSKRYDWASKRFEERLERDRVLREQSRERMALMYEFGPGIEYDRERLIDEARD